MPKVFGWRRSPPSGGLGPAMQMAEHLRRVDLFKDLTKEEMEALFHGVMLQECRPGTVFFTPDEPSERLFVLKTGHVDLYRLTPGGKKLVTRRIGPGTVFGEMGLLGQSMQGGFAEATEISLVCVATKDDVFRLLRHRPDVAVGLLEAMGSRVRQLEERLEMAVFSPVKVRLASFLLSAVDASGAVTGYTHAEIGDTIGALRQTVTETLSEMQAEALVEVGHKRVRVKDRGRLEAIARE